MSRLSFACETPGDLMSHSHFFNRLVFFSSILVDGRKHKSFITLSCEYHRERFGIIINRTMASPPRSKIPGPRSSIGGPPRIRTSVGGRTPSGARVGTPSHNSAIATQATSNNNNNQGTPSRRLPPMADALPLARVASSSSGEEGIQGMLTSCD